MGEVIRQTERERERERKGGGERMGNVRLEIGQRKEEGGREVESVC
jgi:hypothetical protein